ncbi:DUF6340 family protein [Prolixibacteraceae bacterium Z1-6]|uniref:DUF6340 family protein n=1 Tax=Draconibacterium aestuarii TaxID=2998507 RepID=A0A9X3F2E9_9BACT|nr:DUF6340 family protein [Prolixibacteraceae bacterium Z1-6]
MKQLFKQNYILLVFILLFAASCTTTKILTIEIPQPAPKELSDRIQSLVLVNRTVNEKYSDFLSDSLQMLFYKQQFNLDTIILDSTAVDTTIKALGELLFESGRYDFVIPENRFLTFNKNSFFTQEMPWNEVKELCETYDADAVLSLDMFNTRIITKFDKESVFDPMQNGFYSAYSADMTIIYEALFRVYDPLEEKVLVREFFKDTIQWNDFAYSINDLFGHFTPVKQALTETGIALALDFSEKISTVWRQEQRPFYVKGDANLKYAGTFIDDGEWAQAMALWKETEENTQSKSTKSKAQLNMAIAYELQGDIDEAISWALKSYNTMYRQITYQYLELLNRRKKELQNQTK